MSLLIEPGVNLTGLNSFAVPAHCAWFAEVGSQAELDQVLAFRSARELPLLILGDGTNCLFLGDFPGLVLKVNRLGLEWQTETERVIAGAGENWHNLVRESLNKKLYGLENLALIPGSVGAAPIQNIGAYGVELSDLLVAVEVFDLSTGELRVLSREECELGYRDSIFKTAAQPRWLVWGVCLQLSRAGRAKTAYGELQGRFAGQQPSPEQVFAAICEIRRAKLPDPRSLGNAGSFFKNPLISKLKFEELLERYPGLPGYETESPNLIKVPAAWLLEQAGWKGRRRGQAGVHEEHALVLVNHGGASGEDIYLLAQAMSLAVQEQFGIALQPEVRIIGATGG